MEEEVEGGGAMECEEKGRPESYESLVVAVVVLYHGLHVCVCFSMYEWKPVKLGWRCK